MNGLEAKLLNDYQRNFPLCARPYLALARELSTTEDRVIETLVQLKAQGALSRIGATIVPGRLGAATLAALSVPSSRVDAVGALISDYPEVNHNYEREHGFNLWFVVAAPNRGRVEHVLRRIERRAQCGRVLDLPMVTAFHVDLGFDLRGRAKENPQPTTHECTRYAPSAHEARVLGALQDGLAATPRPYAELAVRTASSEEAVVSALEHLLARHVIARLGVIVSHRALGYCANAMAVWDVPDEAVVTAGERLAGKRGVALCYQRERARPLWTYNLYCMLHGKSRDAVTARAADLTLAAGLARYPRALLFSTRGFKQCAARYVA